MKNLMILILLSTGLRSAGQTDSVINTVDSAMLYLTGSFKKYNPQKAFNLFLERANNGEAKAMNAVGLQYAKGLGVDSNFNLALYWLTSAANNGYKKAWVNIGMLYKHIATDSAGYAIAHNYFNTAVQNAELSAYFASGYMYYKGLGCTQSYTNALSLFRQGIQHKRPDCMYFTGLCYKYGYGVAIDADSASYYINKAALLGYHQANAELARNADSSSLAGRGVNIKGSYVNVVHLAESTEPFKKIEVSKEFKKVSGTYSGRLTLYDYSGKKIIEQSPLIFSIEVTGNRITGKWQRGNDDPIEVEAVQQGNQLYFTSTSFLISTLAAKNKKQKLVFKKAILSSRQTKDSSYLTGNVEFFNSYLRETEKPLTIQLAKAANQKDEMLRQNIAVYPNPVSKAFNVSFVAANAGMVKINIYSAQGQLVVTKMVEIALPGKQVIVIDQELKTAGIYILNLSGNNLRESIAFIKE